MPAFSAESKRPSLRLTSSILRRKTGVLLSWAVYEKEPQSARGIAACSRGTDETSAASTGTAGRDANLTPPPPPPAASDPVTLKAPKAEDADDERLIPTGGAPGAPGAPADFRTTPATSADGGSRGRPPSPPARARALGLNGTPPDAEAGSLGGGGGGGGGGRAEAAPGINGDMDAALGGPPKPPDPASPPMPPEKEGIGGGSDGIAGIVGWEYVGCPCCWYAGAWGEDPEPYGAPNWEAGAGGAPCSGADDGASGIGGSVGAAAGAPHPVGPDRTPPDGEGEPKDWGGAGTGGMTGAIAGGWGGWKAGEEVDTGVDGCCCAP